MRWLLTLLLLAAQAQAQTQAQAQPQTPATEYWEGTYDCNQGETGLTLTLDPVPGGGATALFHFYEAPSNPGVPEGCFTMSGTLDRSTGAFDLQAGRWLLQPRTYVSVDLHGTLQDGGAALQGVVAGPGCTTFVLRPVKRPLRPTSACYPALLSRLEQAGECRRLGVAGRNTSCQGFGRPAQPARFLPSAPE